MYLDYLFGILSRRVSKLEGLGYLLMLFFVLSVLLAFSFIITLQALKVNYSKRFHDFKKANIVGVLEEHMCKIGIIYITIPIFNNCYLIFKATLFERKFFKTVFLFENSIYKVFYLFLI